MTKIFLLVSLWLVCFCKPPQGKIKPTIQSISESVYASGIIKSKGEYQVFSTVSGIVDKIFVREGDTVKRGNLILSLSNETQKLNKENAELNAMYSDYVANQGKLNEAKQNIELSRSKMEHDSALYFRQSSLWQQGIGTKAEVELRQLNYENSKASLMASGINYDDLKRQLNFTSAQSKKNLMISMSLQNNYSIKSELDGVVYGLSISKGELVTPQTPLAIIGDAKKFILEMQVDEYDIFKIKNGLTVLVTLDSYKGRAFYAVITKILPLMNERSKTFLIEAEFVQSPEVLYPHITFEANIVTQTKENALLIPREYLWNDSMVVTGDKGKVKVKTGLMDYKKVEILDGIQAGVELIKPKE